MTLDTTVPWALEDQRRDMMIASDEVSAMLRLKALGWGSRRIATEFGCSRNTVRHWLAEGDWQRCASPSPSSCPAASGGIENASARQHHRGTSS